MEIEIAIKDILLQVGIAALAVIGLYGLIHGFLEFFSVPDVIASAVMLSHTVPPEDLEMLLREARRTPFGGGKRGLLLVLDARLLQGDMGDDGLLKEEYAAVAEKYGARICLLEGETTSFSAE